MPAYGPQRKGKGNRESVSPPVQGLPTGNMLKSPFITSSFAFLENKKAQESKLSKACAQIHIFSIKHHLWRTNIQ